MRDVFIDHFPFVFMGAVRHTAAYRFDGFEGKPESEGKGRYIPVIIMTNLGAHLEYAWPNKACNNQDTALKWVKKKARKIDHHTTHTPMNNHDWGFDGWGIQWALHDLKEDYTDPKYLKQPKPSFWQRLIPQGIS